MKRSGPLLAANPLWQQLTENDATATAALFRELCLTSPALQHWLWNDFAGEAHVRETFKQALKDQSAGRQWDSALAGQSEAWLVEQRRLRESMPEAVTYGGLTRIQVEQLIRYYQAAGSVDLGAFLLAQHWRNNQRKGSATLIRATMSFLDAIVKSGRVALLNDFAKALSYLETFKNKAKRASTVGYQDWWKLNLSLYLLQNPRKAYRMRDVTAHLKTLGLKIDLRQIQRFCIQHGIARDTSAGRPRRQTLR
jgi:hypothetical protein